MTRRGQPANAHWPPSPASICADTLRGRRIALVGLLHSGDSLCFLGDSITQADPGYSRLLAALLAADRPELALRFVYAGVSGNRVGHLLERLERDVLAHAPTWVAVSIGINDVWHRHGATPAGTGDADFAAGYRTLLERLLAAGTHPLVVTPTVVHEDLEGGENAELAVLVDCQRALATEMGLPVCDLHAAFREALAARRAALPRQEWPVGGDGRTRFFTTDGVHMNPAGNALMALRLLRTLAG